MKICEYGCGKVAKHQFKNGRWCCESSYRKCSYIRNKISELNKGRTHTKESKLKMSKTHKGKILSEETRLKMSNSKTGVTHSEETKRKISESNMGKTKGYISAFKGKTHTKETKENLREINIGKIPWNKGKTGIYSEETLKKMSLSRKLSIDDIKNKYPLFSRIEKMRYNPDKPGENEIQVHCKNHNCPNSKEKGGWFTPTGHQFESRRRALSYKNGNEAAYFYCCDECKHECPLFNKSVKQLIKIDQIKSGIVKDQYYTQEEYQTWRTEVLKRANYKCEYCGEDVDHAHHIIPQKINGFFSLDPDYGIACCDKCHYKYGHKDECSTGNLASIICENK